MSDYGYTDAPLFVGELRGYRGWVTRGSGSLRSLFKKIRWNSGANIAECHRFSLHPLSDPCPSPACTCGFYAHYSVEDATDYLWSPHLIYGSIMASGTIIPGTKGFRAERARVEAIVLDASVPSRYYNLEEIREAYPDIKLMSNMKKLEKEFPPTPNPWQKKVKPNAGKRKLGRLLSFGL